MTVTVEKLRTILSERLEECLSVCMPYSFAHQTLSQLFEEVERTKAITEALIGLETLTQEEVDNTVTSDGTTILHFVQQVVANKK